MRDQIRLQTVRADEQPGVPNSVADIGNADCDRIDNPWRDDRICTERQREAVHLGRIEWATVGKIVVPEERRCRRIEHAIGWVRVVGLVSELRVVGSGIVDRIDADRLPHRVDGNIRPVDPDAHGIVDGRINVFVVLVGAKYELDRDSVIHRNELDRDIRCVK